MSTKEFGCFFCDGKSSEYNGKCDKCGSEINIGAELMNSQIETYKIESILGRGFFGWTVKAKDQYQPFAIKIMPLHRIAQRRISDEEAKALVACNTPPHRNIAKFFRPIDDKELKLCGKVVPIYSLVFEYIANSVPLNKIIENQEIVLTKGDVVSILGGISSGLARMHSRKIWHNDLHDDNVLIRTVESDENLNERFEPKLIDFGSAKPETRRDHEKADYYYLGKHIFGVVARFNFGNRDKLSPADREFSYRLNRLAHRISEKDVSRRDINPIDIVKEIGDVIGKGISINDFQSFEEMKKQSGVSLSEPLASTNAMNLAPQDIALLFRDDLGWRDKIEKAEPVMIAGPRGCGKTMLLRWLSISSQARPKISEYNKEDVARRLNEEQYIGFLVKIGLIRTPFLRSPYKNLAREYPELAEDFCREYINLHFAFEVLRSMGWLYAEQLANIIEDDLRPLCHSISKFLGVSPRGATTKIELNEMLGLLDNRIIELSNLHEPNKYVPTDFSRDDIFSVLANAIKTISWLTSKEIWYLLDDYSQTILPQFAIRAYNPAIFRLSGNFRIKLSSEGAGPTLIDNLNRHYKEAREFSRVNLGEIYFQSSENQGLQFFEAILKARFDEIGKGSLDELKKMLGQHESEGENFGRYICSKAKPGDSKFYGFNLLCSLCSGDISFIIELLNLIVRGRWGDAHLKIGPEEQDQITKQFAQRLLQALRSNPKLYDFAEKLGNLLKQYLLASKDKDTIDERLRLEIEGQGELSEKAQYVHDELLTNSVLIQGGIGKSKKGLPTRKYFFRRLFAPCFPFSPTRKGCIPLTVQEYEQWLNEPNKIRTINGSNNLF